MRKQQIISFLFGLIIVGGVCAADVILGKFSQLTWSGEGTTRIATFTTTTTTTTTTQPPGVWYQMTGEDTNTTQLLDSIGSLDISNRPSVATGPTVSNLAPVCYYFDAADDAFYDGFVLLSSTQNWGVSLWLNQNSTITNDGSDRAFFSQYGPSPQASDGRMFFGKSSRTNQWEVFLGSDASGLGNVILQIKAGPIAGGDWHHVAVVRINSNFYAYCDAVLNHSITEDKMRQIKQVKSGILAVTKIGGDAELGFIKGLIDDVRIYTNATIDIDPLPPVLITNIYNAGRQ